MPAAYTAALVKKQEVPVESRLGHASSASPAFYLLYCLNKVEDKNSDKRTPFLLVFRLYSQKKKEQDKGGVKREDSQKLLHTINAKKEVGRLGGEMHHACKLYLCLMALEDKIRDEKEMCTSRSPQFNSGLVHIMNPMHLFTGVPVFTKKWRIVVKGGVPDSSPGWVMPEDKTGAKREVGRPGGEMHHACNLYSVF
ncbi:hypothetical protein B0H17DRAFT_1146994 [Mycena rosella]|uniref:Uncharacterized protein n=1 Tax=Mycena rosella TaxID=1033263 RepID=A0AAD7CMM6_MYCRO|nr:hypothetical protein B0H17DRAFT_1146994 [Mycena rosella]